MKQNKTELNSSKKNPKQINLQKKNVKISKERKKTFKNSFIFLKNPDLFICLLKFNVVTFLRSPTTTRSRF